MLIRLFYLFWTMEQTYAYVRREDETPPAAQQALVPGAADGATDLGGPASEASGGGDKAAPGGDEAGLERMSGGGGGAGTGQLRQQNPQHPQQAVELAAGTRATVEIAADGRAALGGENALCCRSREMF